MRGTAGGVLRGTEGGSRWIRNSPVIECGKTYKWKPEFAGKKVKCKCGYVMTAPKAPPARPRMSRTSTRCMTWPTRAAGGGGGTGDDPLPVVHGRDGTGDAGLPVVRLQSQDREAQSGRGRGARAAAADVVPRQRRGPSSRDPSAAAAVRRSPPRRAARWRPSPAFGKPRVGLQKDAEDTGVLTECVLPIVIIAVGARSALSAGDEV